jgi:hypothetical protein
MTMKQLFDRANDLANTFENGNRKDCVEGILESKDPATSCVLACCVFEVMSDEGRLMLMKMFDMRRGENQFTGRESI